MKVRVKEPNPLSKKKIFILLSILGITSLSAAFYTTNEAVFIHSSDKNSINHLNFVDFNLIQPAPQLDSSSYIPQFDDQVNDFMKRWDIKGASIAIMKDNRLIYSRGYGFSNLEEEVPTTTRSLFRIASASKLVTAVGIMKMKDDCLLSLDEPVFGKNGILGEYPDMLDQKHLQITVGHLLNHKGGWSWRDGDFMFQSSKIKRVLDLEGPPNQDDIIQFVLNNRRLRYKPGTQYAYSNFGYMLLGKIIEAKSGMNYEQYMNQEILEPNGIYGMRLSHNYEWEKLPFEVNYYDYPSAYQYPSFDESYEAVNKPYGGNDVYTLGAAGAWIANASQMVKLISLIDPKNAYYNILSEESILEMTEGANHNDAFGWKGTNGDDWWRTGTLAGTSCFMQRRADGYTYAVILNSSVWMGHNFNKYIQWMMDDALNCFEAKEYFNYFWENRPEKTILPMAS